MTDDIQPALDKLTFQPHGRAERPKGRPRFRRIVLAQDGSPGAVLAEEWAAHLGIEHDAEVIVATALAVPSVAPEVAAGYGWWAGFQAEYVRVQDLCRAAADESVARLAKQGVRARRAVVPGRPVPTLVRIAEDERADLVILGSVRRGTAARIFLSSVGQGVLQRAHASILLARTPPPARVVVAGVDGSHESRRAVAYALDLASRGGKRAHVEHVIEFPDEHRMEPVEGHLRDTIARLDLPAGPPGVSYHLGAGDPGERLLARVAEEKADLVVVGARGLGAVAGALVGSVSQRIAARSDASVLVLKRPPHEA